MLRVFLMALVMACPSVAYTQSTLAPNAPEDKPVGFTGDQHQRLLKAVAPYVAQARKTWPTAKANYLKGLPPKHVFFVTVELADMRGKREITFVEVQKIENGIITGLIANEISTVSGYKAGQRFSIAEAEIWDWTISKPDGTEDGNLVGKFLETYKL
jgi:uncharacterized protein YegJ (DUF2314 family)